MTRSQFLVWIFTPIPDRENERLWRRWPTATTGEGVIYRVRK